MDRLLRNDDWYELRLPPERLNPAGFRQLRELENVALDLVTEYADRFWRRERRRWEHDRIEITTLDEDDPNHVRAWKLSMDAAGDKLAEDARALADALREGRFEDLKSWYESLKFGLIRNEAHAYRPLLHVGQDRAVTVQPVPLDENEKRVVDHLESLAGLRHAWLQGRELYLIRNLTRGRGVSFFDDFGYYPDFIVWLKDDARQHVLFLDPKGLSRFGGRERRKVALHHEIGKIEDRLRKDDPNLQPSRLRPLRDPGRPHRRRPPLRERMEAGRRLLPRRARLAATGHRTCPRTGGARRLTVPREFPARAVTSEQVDEGGSTALAGNAAETSGERLRSASVGRRISPESLRPPCPAARRIAARPSEKYPACTIVVRSAGRGGCGP